MVLDPAMCYQAVLSRDPRFDGRFFTGVLTTGIYCRPVCPARTPRLENVRFFACSAAAEDAGFRPCRRCRPETAPGTPAWTGTCATIARSLRLIAEGALDRSGVDEMAERLGVGARHLRRLFAERLGASPLAIARTRRVHFARRLIDETDLPIADIAFASGFRSLRRFNTAIREAFGGPPTALRARHGLRMERRGRDPRHDSGNRSAPRRRELSLRLPFRPPFDWDSILAFFACRAIPGVEEVVDRAYRRTIETGGRAGTIEIRCAPGGGALLLQLGTPPSDDLLRVVERARRLFDLDADPLPIAAHLAKDPFLGAAVAARPGLRVPGAWDPFEIAIRAVLGQQVSVAGARTLAGRLVRAHGETLPAASGALTHVFPTPRALACGDLTSIGLPRARAEALRALATAFRDRPDLLDGAPGLDDALLRLQEIPGIGPWTAGYIAMRGMGEPDALPSGDLGLRRALRGGSVREIESRAEAWRPWRAYATIHVWHPDFAVAREPRETANRSRRRKR